MGIRRPYSNPHPQTRVVTQVSASFIRTSLLLQKEDPLSEPALSEAVCVRLKVIFATHWSVRGLRLKNWLTRACLLIAVRRFF
jgi:hypothetical protein